MGKCISNIIGYWNKVEFINSSVKSKIMLEVDVLGIFVGFCLFLTCLCVIYLMLCSEMKFQAIKFHFSGGPLIHASIKHSSFIINKH